MSKKVDTIITDTSDEILFNYEDIPEFMNQCFIRTLVSKGKTPSETQARAIITGIVFEKCVAEVIDQFAPRLKYECRVYLPQACMDYSGADLVLYDSDGIDSVIELKGSAEQLEWPSGEITTSNRPGLMRSDTMKKAVCQAYQVKQINNDLKFHIITSHKPKSGSAKCLYDMANGDIIDSTVSIQDSDNIQSFLQQKQQQTL